MTAWLMTPDAMIYVPLVIIATSFKFFDPVVLAPLAVVSGMAVWGKVFGNHPPFKV